MSHPTDETREPITDPDWTASSMDTPVPAADPVGTPAGFEVEEQTPDGGRPDDAGPAPTEPPPAAAGGRGTPDVEDVRSDARRAPAAPTRRTTTRRRNWSGTS